MKLYRKLIKPVIAYLDAEDNRAHSNLEETDAWYPEEEQELLYEKYKYLEDGFHTIAFEEKYEEVKED